VLGKNHPAKMALLRATAGIWETGSGQIVRPGANRILFLPERPYLLPGTLRQVLSPAGRDPRPSDEEIARVTGIFDLDPVLARVGGLDVEADWSSALSLGEQQLVAVARLVLAAPPFAFLERPYTTLTPDESTRVLDELTQCGTTYVTFTDREIERDHYDAVLELHPDGSWDWKSVRGAASPAQEA
jgi:putative ATP-binding cassette transporter